MKSILSISFLLGSLVSTISSTSEGTVTFRASLTSLTSHEPKNYVDITVPFEVFRPLENPVHSFNSWIENVQDTTTGLEGVGCLLFKDAAGTDALRPIFAVSAQSDDNWDHSVPDEIGSVLCLKADDPRLLVESAGKEPDLPAASAEPDLPAASAEPAPPAPDTGGRYPPNPEQKKPAAKPFFQPGTGGTVYPDDYRVPHQEARRAIRS